MARKKCVKKSAIFESEDRWKSLERDLKGKNKLGPGQYTLASIMKKKNKQKKPKNNDITLPKLEKVMEMINEMANPE